MARKKLPDNKVGRTQQYYNRNPKKQEEKNEQQVDWQKRTPEDRKKRAELAKRRRKLGIMGKGGGDLSHQYKGDKYPRQLSIHANRRANGHGDQPRYR